MLLIRNHYREAFKEIVRQHGEGEEDAPYKINADCYLPRAIGYTQKYVIGDKYRRYERCARVLVQALAQLDFRSADKPIVHLDLGCGPGVFSWVVRDYLVEQCDKEDNEIMLLGYDHAPNMIKLAGLFCEHLPKELDYNLVGFSGDSDIDIDKLQKVLRPIDFISNRDVIVTFGYVLVQTEGNDKAMKNFAKIIESLLSPSGSCILLAVDAHKTRWVDSPWIFHEACNQLKAALDKCGLHLTEQQFGTSLMYARLSINH